MRPVPTHGGGAVRPAGDVLGRDQWTVREPRQWRSLRNEVRERPVGRGVQRARQPERRLEPRLPGIGLYVRRRREPPATRLYPVDDASIWINGGAGSRLYLADITPVHKGQMMYVDLYDVGDGSGISPFSVQVKGPSGGAPSPVPTGAGTIVPAPGTATSCSYNPVPSTTRGPATPNAAANCTVVTKAAGSSGGIYNDGWLRIAIQLAPDYTCGTAPGTDCWWTLQYEFGPQSFPTDRVVYSVHVG